MIQLRLPVHAGGTRRIAFRIPFHVLQLTFITKGTKGMPLKDVKAKVCSGQVWLDFQVLSCLFISVRENRFVLDGMRCTSFRGAFFEVLISS